MNNFAVYFLLRPSIERSALCSFIATRLQRRGQLQRGGTCSGRKQADSTPTESLIHPMTLAATKESLPITLSHRFGSLCPLFAAREGQQCRQERIVLSNAFFSAGAISTLCKCYLAVLGLSDASRCNRSPLPNHNRPALQACARPRSWPRLNAGDKVAFLYRKESAALQWSIMQIQKSPTSRSR